MFRTIRYLVLVGGALLLVFAPRPAAAQVSTGSLSGSVVDATGAAIQGTQITATNVATGAQSQTTSNTVGLFRLYLLPAGTYRVEVTKAGFSTLAVPNVEVNVGADHGLGQLALRVGAVSTTVEVSGSPALLQTSQVQVTNAISGTALTQYAGIQENEGLDYLTLTMPGVVSPRDLGYSNSNGTGFSVNGIRARNNDQEIDGQNNNDNSVTGPALFLTNPDFVQQYQATTNNFGPEYGRNSGSVVNIITKSGTNNWHGTVSGTEGNSAMDTLSNTQKRFEGLKKVPRYNDEFTSATIGGPLWKDHVFIFGGFDDEINSSKTVYASGNLTPTPTGVGEMASCFPGSPSVQALASYGPFGVGGGDPTVSPGSEGDVLLSGGGFAGFTPNNVDGKCHVQMGGVQRTLGDSYHQYDWIYRTDVVVSNKDRFYGRYLFNKLSVFNLDDFGTAAAGYPVNVPSLSQDIALSWTHTFTPMMVNEVRLSFGRANIQFGGNTIGNTIPTQGNIGEAVANVSFGTPGLLGFGAPTYAPQGRVIDTYQVQDNWRYSLGRHQITAGVNYTQQRSPNIFLPNYNGSFTFDDWSTFAQDVPAEINIAQGNPHIDFRENDTFLYFGDDYKVARNLTVTLGLTWSYYGQPVNLYNQETTKRESNPTTAFWDTSLPLSVRTVPAIPSVKNSFGPGVGFAYSPNWGGWLTGNGKTVIRGGYRLAYDPPFYNIYTNMASSAPLVLLQSLSGVPMPADLTGPNVRTLLASYLVKGVDDPRSFNQSTVAPNFGPDRVHEWTFGIQREIVRDAVFEARYVGNHGFDLFQSVNANPYIADLAAAFPSVLPSGAAPCPAADAVVPTAVGRLHCNDGIVRERTNTGYSDYEGLQLQLRTTNLFRQLTMRANYTFSKTTDNSSLIFSNYGGGSTIAFSQNPLNYTSGEHSLSGLDIPQAFSLTFAEELPFLRDQHGVVGHVLGGWGVTATYLLSSGQVYTPQQAVAGVLTGAVGSDYSFNIPFIGILDTFRPFIGNPQAPADQVGIFALDACYYFGVTGGEPICNLANTSPDALVSFNGLNTTSDISTYTPQTVNSKQVRYIVDGGEAQTVFNQPYGNAGRNSLRDAKTNTANISIYKNFKFGERATLQWHMSLINAFNHPNYSSVDPFIEDAGLVAEGTGFANPSLTSGGNRTLRFGLKVIF
jgi:Carboxypeptidase regulatory-like domain